eukprot:825570-Rhodomonas_salina.1
MADWEAEEVVPTSAGRACPPAVLHVHQHNQDLPPLRHCLQSRTHGGEGVPDGQQGGRAEL